MKTLSVISSLRLEGESPLDDIALSTQDVGINLAILNFKNDQAADGEQDKGFTGGTRA